MSQENIEELFNEIASARGVESSQIVNALESGISIAARLKTGEKNLKAVFDIEAKSFLLFQMKRAQEEVNDPSTEIAIDEAREKNREIKTGDEVAIPFDYPNIGRLAAMVVRRTMKKSMDEIAADHIKDKMELQKWKMVAVEVKGENSYGDILCKAGLKRAVLPRKEQLFREKLEMDSVVQAVVIDVTRHGKEPIYILSRTHPLLLGALFVREIPEINDGHVVIRGIARDTAGQSKIAVVSKNEKIDAKGSCIGPAGERVRRIMDELDGEKIDIIEWSEDPQKYISAALTPAKVKKIWCNHDRKDAVVEVEKDQHPIAVGKKGLNIRLASRLTRWEINIK